MATYSHTHTHPRAHMYIYVYIYNTNVFKKMMIIVIRKMIMRIILPIIRITIATVLQ